MLRDYMIVLDNRAKSGANTYHALPAGAERPEGRPATDPAQDIDTALATDPAALIVAFPSNDAMAGFAALETVANLLLLRQRAEEHGVAMLVLSSQPRNDASETQNVVMMASDEALSGEFGGCFVHVRQALADEAGKLAAAYDSGDGVHLSAAGHRVVFEHVKSAIGVGRCLSANLRLVATMRHRSSRTVRVPRWSRVL
jgi:hypothetical protein